MQNVQFRRIGGHIVPIKLSKAQQKEVGQGAGLTVSGVAVAAAAGKLYRANLSKSTAFAARGWNALERIDALKTTRLRNQSLFAATARMRGVAKIAEKGDDFLKAGARIGRFAPALRIGGLVAGSALIGAGASKIYGALNKKVSDKEKIGVAGAVATGAFLTGAYGGAGFRTVIKPAFVKAYPAFRAFKSAWRL